jgi:NhaA family Na+:H+ antiporter
MYKKAMNLNSSENILRPIERLTKPLVRFLHIEAASGIFLLLATGVAIIAANSHLRDAYAEFWNMTMTLGIGDWSLSYPLWYWVNDGLMTIFFFLVGLEIKREIVCGELQDIRRVFSPVGAALGGAVAPAVIFLILLGDHPGWQGWAIPMATDIAFVVGALALLGRRVPHGLKVFVLTLAIVDDIIAVLVIAVFYSSQISFAWLLAAVSGIAVIVLMNRMGIRTVAGYIFVGAVIWLCTLKSGVHPTISGVALGLLTPALPLITRDRLGQELKRALDSVNGEEHILETVRIRDAIEEVTFSTRESISPLERFETSVHPWAAFLIMPIFALANAGVPFSVAAVSSQISFAVILALFIGKSLGITLSLLLIVKTGLGIIPGGSNWRAMIGCGCLAGIGFTMSLFVASLSLEGGLLVQAKMGILVGSAISGIAGLVLLASALKRP